jgi:hypothetical protein
MTYTIHRYPAELIDVVHLRDGGRVTVRPILPQDAEIVQAFVQTLSDGARRHRFFRTLRELPADLLRRSPRWTTTSTSLSWPRSSPTRARPSWARAAT